MNKNKGPHGRPGGGPATQQELDDDSTPGREGGGPATTEELDGEAPRPAASSEVEAAEETVRRAKADLDNAQVALRDAEALRDEAAKAEEPKPERGKHILLDSEGTGTYAMQDAPPDYQNDRRLSINGVNYEVVSQTPDGVFQYRAM